MDREQRKPSPREHQIIELRKMGLDKHVVDEIAEMNVLEGYVYLYDTRQKTAYTKCKVRVILGNDIDLPYKPERFSHKYPFQVDTATLALSDIVQTALNRVLASNGYVPSENDSNAEKTIKEIIDRAKENQNAAIGVTIVITEGAVWEGKHTFQPHSKVSYYTEQLIEKVSERYGQNNRQLVLLASCNEKDGPRGEKIHATLTPPSNVDLVYVKGLASIFHGNGQFIFVRGK